MIKNISYNEDGLKLTLNGEIAPCSRPRVSKFGTYYPKKYSEFKKILKKELKEHFNLQHQYFDTPLELDITIYKKIPKSYSKRKYNELIYRPHISKPDIDNLVKSLLDCMSGILFNDDSCIYKISCTKVWHNEDLCIIDIKSV